MNTKQKLTKIRAKCVELLAKYPPCESTAGWRATIAAIDMAFVVLGKGLNDDICDNDGRGCRACEETDGLVSGILKAWEGMV